MPRRSTAIEAPRAGNSHRRVLIVALVLVGWMFIIGARLVQLQVSQHETFTARARNQQLSSIETSATRGPVVDRQGRELARSVEIASFFADPREVLNANETAKKIAAITGQDRDELAKRLNTAIDARKQFIWIARRVDIEAAKKLDAMELKGIYSRKEPKR
jgi:cell division protein FtsI (penicillin-binding protein 3)